MISVKITKLEIEHSLKQRIDIICKFAGVKPKYKKGSIRTIEKTNLNYIEPHQIIIKNKIFLAFNNSNDIYIGNLQNKIKLSELENYLKKMD